MKIRELKMNCHYDTIEREMIRQKRYNANKESQLEQKEKHLIKAIQPKIHDPYYEPILEDFQTCIQTPDLQIDRMNNIKNEMMMQIQKLQAFEVDLFEREL